MNNESMTSSQPDTQWVKDMIQKEKTRSKRIKWLTIGLVIWLGLTVISLPITILMVHNFPVKTFATYSYWKTIISFFVTLSAWIMTIMLLIEFRKPDRKELLERLEQIEEKMLRLDTKVDSSTR